MGTFSISHWLIVLLAFAPFALGNYFIADRMGRNKALWVILTLVPLINFVFMYYVMFAVIVYVLDKLNTLAGSPETADS